MALPHVPPSAFSPKHPTKCYKPLLTRTPSLLLFLFLNLALVLLIEVSFRTLPAGTNPDNFISEVLNYTATASASAEGNAKRELPSTISYHPSSTPASSSPHIAIVSVNPRKGINPPCWCSGTCNKARSGSDGGVTSQTSTFATSAAVLDSQPPEAGSTEAIAVPHHTVIRSPVSSLLVLPPCCYANGGGACAANTWCPRFNVTLPANDAILPTSTLAPSAAVLGRQLLGAGLTEVATTPSLTTSQPQTSSILGINRCCYPNGGPCPKGVGCPMVSIPPQSSSDYGITPPTSTLAASTTVLATKSPGAVRIGMQEATTTAQRAGVKVLRRSITEPSIHRRSVTYYTISNGVYFVGTYLPVIVAVILNVLWGIMATSIKAMEPYYQLADPHGASGDRSLSLKSTTSGVGLVAYRAASHRHWAIFWSSVISLVLAVIVPLSSEVMFVDTKANCVPEAPDLTHCYGKLRISSTTGRIVEGSLGFIALLIASLAVIMWNRWSGVFADPSSIAGLATLFQNEEVQDEFRSLNPHASDDELARAIACKRYQLGYYQNPSGDNGYGLIVCKGEKGKSGDGWDESSITNSNTDNQSRDIHLRREPHAHITLWLHPASIVGFALCLIGLLIIITYYHLVMGNSGFEKFMDSQGFGVSFMMTAFGVLVKSYWAKVEEETRVLEPFRNLSRENARPRDSILVSSKSSPVIALVAAVVRARAFLAFLAFNTVLAEMLTVAISRVPFRGDSTFMGYTTSVMLSISIISFMLATLIWVGARRRMMVDLPRRPDTIATVLMYLCGSRMLRDFQGLETLGGKERDAVVERMGKRYRLGRVVGVDGVERVGIEDDTCEVKG